MLLLSASVALSFLGSFVYAQSNNTTALKIATIETQFTNAQLVPSLLKTFRPSALMNVNFSGIGPISPGQDLTKQQVASAPEISIVPANSSVSLQGNYTLVMVDANVIGTNQSVGQTRHLLVNDVTLTGSSSLNVSTAHGVAVTEYAGPSLGKGSGAHRYVILLLPQPSSFSPPANLSKPNVGVSVFHLTEYISTSHLGQPIAGMYFDVEQGTGTATVSPTSSVVTSISQPGTSSASSSSSTPRKSSNAAIRPVGNSVVVTLPAVAFVLLASYMCL
ncbi:phosphatidylethanolamine-binding protein [Lactifluus subvellereus]|nr:phosphatidylethanolamine-binding protein [Lactifluus subvellereus]